MNEELWIEGEMENKKWNDEEAERVLERAASKLGCLFIWGIIFGIACLIYLLGLQCVKQTIKTFSQGPTVASPLEEPLPPPPSTIP